MVKLGGNLKVGCKSIKVISQVLFRYGYRLQRGDTMTDPLKKIELFKALASPAYIVASLENSNEVSSDFFCPVKTCFEFACEANFRKSTIPEYKREYAEIESRWAGQRAALSIYIASIMSSL